MKCKDCNTATYNCKCIECMARLILILPLKLRAHSIEGSNLNVDALKAEVIKQHNAKDKK